MAIYSKFKIDNHTKRCINAVVKKYGKGALRSVSFDTHKFCYDLLPVMRQQMACDESAKVWTYLEVEGLRHVYNAKWHNLFLSSQELIDFINEIKIPDESKNLALMVEDFGEKFRNGIVVHLNGGKESWMFYTNHEYIRFNQNHYNDHAQNAMLCHKRFVQKDDSYFGYCFIDRQTGRVYEDIKKGGHHIEFFVKLLIYIDAFPDAVTQGVPKDCSDTHIRRDMASVVSAAKQIKNMISNGICPHLRRGHFRFLQSDKFTNKRFQTVYVKPAIIGGTAETVKHQSVVC